MLVIVSDARKKPPLNRNAEGDKDARDFQNKMCHQQRWRAKIRQAKTLVDSSRQVE